MGIYDLLIAAGFIVPLLLCEGLFAINLPRRTFFAVRLLSVPALFGLAYGIDRLLGLLDWGPVFSARSMVLFTLIFVLSMGALFICFKISFKGVLFVGIGGYSLQHIAYSLATAVGYFIGLSGPGGYWTVLVMEFAVYLAVGLPFYFLVIKPGMHKGGPLKEKDFRLVMLTFVVLASSIVLSIFATRAESPDFVSEVVCRLYAIIGCSLTLFMQFGVAKESRLHAEKLVMEQLLHMEHRQHEISRETIDIINLKCHDIKHQIDALATVNDAAERKAALDEFGGVVLIYDGMLKTENDTLDLVLTEKSLICGQYGIKLNCIADGKSIGFLGKTDIYTLFGNAIDNAVECIRREDADKRFINLSVLRKDEMLFIHIDNFCADSVVFEDGLPVTTKADKQYHGFGTKSIKYIAQKYGGEARMGVQNSRFNLDVFLPAAF